MHLPWPPSPLPNQDVLMEVASVGQPEAPPCWRSRSRSLRKQLPRTHNPTRFGLASPGNTAGKQAGAGCPRGGKTQHHRPPPPSAPAAWGCRARVRGHSSGGNTGKSPGSRQPVWDTAPHTGAIPSGLGLINADSSAPWRCASPTACLLQHRDPAASSVWLSCWG